MSNTNSTNNTTQKTKMMSNTKNQEWTQVFGKQFLSLIRHSPCYSYCQDMNGWCKSFPWIICYLTLSVTWWRLFQKRVVCTKDIYVFII
jgi:hypothetical protein